MTCKLHDFKVNCLFVITAEVNKWKPISFTYCYSPLPFHTNINYRLFVSTWQREQKWNVRMFSIRRGITSLLKHALLLWNSHKCLFECNAGGSRSSVVQLQCCGCYVFSHLVSTTYLTWIFYVTNRKYILMKLRKK